MKSIFLFLSFFLMQFSYSQSKAIITFAKTEHDFGTILEVNGPQTYEFKLKNTGTAPLVINNIEASCGCTTPEWSKAPIAAGKEGYVKVSFDPKDRPGSFSKTITVSSNATVPEKILTIKGIVKERAKTIDDEYQYTLNGLKMTSSHVAMTRVYSNSSKKDVLDLYNSTDKPIVVQFDQIPSHLTISPAKLTVAPKQKAVVNFTFDATKKKDFGFVSDRVMVIIDNKRDSKNKITVSADIQEDFSKLTKAQLDATPKAGFNSTIHDLGLINSGEKKTFSFTLTNNGKTDLIVRKISSNCGCTVAKLQSMTIKPGQSTKIDVNFDAKGLTGKQNKTITVITNDPQNSTTILRIKGDIK